MASRAAAYFAGIGTVVAAMAAGFGGAVLLMDATTPHKEPGGTAFTKHEARPVPEKPAEPVANPPAVAETTWSPAIPSPAAVTQALATASPVAVDTPPSKDVVPEAARVKSEPSLSAVRRPPPSTETVGASPPSEPLALAKPTDLPVPITENRTKEQKKAAARSKAAERNAKQGPERNKSKPYIVERWIERDVDEGPVEPVPRRRSLFGFVSDN